MIVPLTHPCTYPLHVKQKHEPEWTRYDIEEIAWCDRCKAKQQVRMSKAKKPGYKRHPFLYWNRKLDTQSIKRKSYLAKSGARGLSWFARKYTPEGYEWCAWGKHYYDESIKKQIGTAETPCKYCVVHLRAWRHRQELKPELAMRHGDLQKEVTALRKERLRLRDEIVVLEKKLKEMKILVDDLEAKGVDGSTTSRLKILPVAPHRSNDRVARSYV